MHHVPGCAERRSAALRNEPASRPMWRALAIALMPVILGPGAACGGDASDADLDPNTGGPEAPGADTGSAPAAQAGSGAGNDITTDIPAEEDPFFHNEFCVRSALVEISFEVTGVAARELAGGPLHAYGPWLSGGEIWASGQETLWTLEGDELTARGEVGVVRDLLAGDFGGDEELEVLALLGVAWQLLVPTDDGYRAASPPPGGALPQPAAFPYDVADVNGDGNLDLATVELGFALVLEGDGMLGFARVTPAASLQIPFANSRAVASEVHRDADGTTRLLTINTPTGGATDQQSDVYISVHRDGFLRFSDREVFELGLRTSGNRSPTVHPGARFADFDGDEGVDLVFAESGVLWLVAGEPDGGFGDRTMISTFEPGAVSPMHAGDFDGDGDEDIALPHGGGLTVAWGDGEGGFELQPVSTELGTIEAVVARPPEPGAAPRLIARVTTDC